MFRAVVAVATMMTIIMTDLRAAVVFDCYAVLIKRIAKIHKTFVVKKSDSCKFATLAILVHLFIICDIFLRPEDVENAASR